jgi:hypothetical protein
VKYAECLQTTQLEKCQLYDHCLKILFSGLFSKMREKFFLWWLTKIRCVLSATAREYEAGGLFAVYAQDNLWLGLFSVSSHLIGL